MLLSVSISTTQIQIHTEIYYLKTKNKKNEQFLVFWWNTLIFSCVINYCDVIHMYTGVLAGIYVVKMATWLFSLDLLEPSWETGPCHVAAKCYTANMRRWFNVGLLLVYRLQRWHNSIPPFVYRHTFEMNALMFHTIVIPPNVIHSLLLIRKTQQDF